MPTTKLIARSITDGVDVDAALREAEQVIDAEIVDDDTNDDEGLQ